MESVNLFSDKFQGDFESPLCDQTNIYIYIIIYSMIPSQCRHCCGEKLWGVCKNICGNKNPGRFMGVLGVEMMFLYSSLSGARGPSGDLVTFHQKFGRPFGHLHTGVLYPWAPGNSRRTSKQFQDGHRPAEWKFRSTGNSTDMDISMVGSPCCEKVNANISWIH